MMSAKDVGELRRAGAQARRDGHDDGVKHGMAMAAALLARDFGQGTLALEILGAAGLDSAKAVRDLRLEEYDAAPLLKLVK